jgi:hypothetical protein
MRVMGIRGALVGHVAAVDEGCIQVEPEGKGESFWIRSEAVIGVDGNRVELICDAGEVHRYLMDAPPRK